MYHNLYLVPSIVHNVSVMLLDFYSLNLLFYVLYLMF